MSLMKSSSSDTKSWISHSTMSSSHWKGNATIFGWPRIDLSTFPWQCCEKIFSTHCMKTMAMSVFLLKVWFSVLMHASHSSQMNVEELQCSSIISFQMNQLADRSWTSESQISRNPLIDSAFLHSHDHT